MGGQVYECFLGDSTTLHRRGLELYFNKQLQQSNLRQLLFRTTQSLAHGIRSQFQFMVEEYGLEGIGELMPLMVNIREKQDSALADNQLIRSFHGKIESIKESAAIKITRG